MMKKKLLIILAVIVVLTVPISVFAATSDTQAAKTVRGFFGLDFSKLTDQQKADVKDYSKKMADLQKDFINKMVSNGSMTREDGDAAIKRIDEAQQNGETGMIPGFGMGRKGFGGPGRGGMGIGNVDTSKLTDQQKTDLLATYKKMADLQKELVDKMVAGTLLTKDQGDKSKTGIDEAYKALQDNGLAGKGGFGGLGGFDCFGLRDIDQSKITDQLKTDLKDYSTKLSELQKEVVNKLVSFGTLTKEQGDNAAAKIDEMQKMQQEKGFPGGMGGMGKGRMGGHGMRGNFKDNTTNSSDTANAPAT